MKKTVVPIQGMHCKSCTMLIGDALQEISGVKRVYVNLKHKNAEIFSESDLDMEKVTEAIKNAGYEIGEEKKQSWISTNVDDYKDIGLGFVFVIFFYFVASWFGLFSINVGNGDPSNLFLVLLVGITAGLSTCMALVGGLVLGISTRHAEKHPEATPLQKFRPHLYFNIGRISSYFLLGGIIGMAGQVFQLSGPVLGIITIFVGMVMLFLGIKLLEIFPKFSHLSLTLPSGISRLFGIRKHHEKEYSHYNSLFVGALTFFLPCGFTQAMQLYAMSTGNFLSGALIMSVFAIGTAPGLLGIGGLTSVIKGIFARRFFKFAGIIVIALAFFNISNGYNLTGWSFDLGKSTFFAPKEANISLENGVQIAKMKETASGYSPRSFTVTKGVPVKWIIDAQDMYSCAASLSVSKLGITKSLKKGENIVEFTPEEVGTIKFSCSMGMYRGEFTVVDAKSSSSEASGENLQEKEIAPSQNVNTNTSKAPLQSSADVQLLKTTYISSNQDISPYEFTVTSGKPVRLEVDVRENGSGCMSTIMIPGLYNYPEYLEKGKTIAMEFTPQKKGDYPITCGMGVPRGIIKVL
ncbi:sulfite exporter TauE/SafE family protein [Candidatus Peregrinibacteria bacterium]|nr:sulfite exporter TauE/SafE family protein [Candidatus Peregrinibacteria bacterium]